MGRFSGLLLCVLLLFAHASYAQLHKGGMVKLQRHSTSAMHVPRSKQKIMCPIFQDTGYPYQGIGIKVGDPVALTYKFYPNKKLSFAVDFGKSASGLYSRYYREKFNEYINSDTLSDDSEVDYLNHKVKSDWVTEFKVMYNFEAEKIAPGLQFYIGAGWEWRSTQLKYDYIFTYKADPKFQSFDRNHFTQGVEGVIGIEYSYFNLPISAFIELELYNDIQSDPEWRHTQGGIGVRYVF